MKWKNPRRSGRGAVKVVVPDLPGIGNSSTPSHGPDMKSAAQSIRDAVHSLGLRNVRVVGHDIGLMVAYAYAAMYPQEVEKLALMDAFLPGVAGWEPIYNDPAGWHFRFYGPTPVALVAGRERTYFEHFWNDFAADKNRSIPETSRREYTLAYARPGEWRPALPTLHLGQKRRQILLSSRARS
jgi:pimeloyl-ACP methyl ester carboxylesterase